MSASNLFIVLDGVDGCGKSTQVNLLMNRLKQFGRKPIQFRDPGSTAVAEAIRRIVLDATYDVAPMQQMLLFSAARVSLAEIIHQSLRSQDVVCDRWISSTLAYQGLGVSSGVARERLLQLIMALHNQATDKLWPTATVLVDTDPAVARERVLTSGKEVRRDRFDGRPLSWFVDLRNAFHNAMAFAKEQHTFAGSMLSVSGHGTPEEVHERIWQALIGTCPAFARVIAAVAAAPIAAPDVAG